MKKTIVATIAICLLVLALSAFASAEEADSRVKVGELLGFGSFEQDNDAADGVEPIQWRILDAQGERITLISVDTLLGRAIDEAGKAWADSALRGYLNGEFLQSAFTEEEHALLLSNADGDSVTILTEAEAEALFQTAEDRQSRLTQAAEAELGFAFRDGALWWLQEGSLVTGAGFPIRTRLDTSRAIAGVRPVIYLKSEYFETRYSEAKALLDAGSFDEAAAALAALNNYADSAQLLADIPYYRGKQALEQGDVQSAYQILTDASSQSEAAKELLESDPTLSELAHSADAYKVRDSIQFGSYDKAVLEWKVVSKEGTRLTLLSEYAVASAPYDEEKTLTTWENCSLRAWLNGDFLSEAFTETERACLAPTSEGDLVTLPDYLGKWALTMMRYKIKTRSKDPSNPIDGIWTVYGGRISKGENLMRIKANTSKGMGVSPVIVVETASDSWRALTAAEEERLQELAQLEEQARLLQQGQAQPEEASSEAPESSEAQPAAGAEASAGIERIDIFINDELAQQDVIQVTQPVDLQWEAVGGADVSGFHIDIYAGDGDEPIYAKDIGATDAKAQIPVIAAGTTYRLVIRAVPAGGGDAEAVSTEARFQLAEGQ